MLETYAEQSSERRNSTPADAVRHNNAARVRVLVALASYGTKNEQYLRQVCQEYSNMRHQAHVVVLSNIPRNLGPDVEVRVGLPSSNPWSLPFGHRQLFADRMHEYDIFIYAEDDILISQRNIDAFVTATSILPRDLLAGFVHAEQDERGELYYDPLLSHFHWDPQSVRAVNGQTFAHFTNEHCGCYIMTREHLARAIESGGFLVPPHEGRYDLLCTAATDPYTQCGFRKMICLSQVDDFTVLHLPNNKHAAHPYRARNVFDRQVRALLNLSKSGRPSTLLFNPETKLLQAKWSKSYYEPVRQDMIRLVPAQARTVLSIGTGWGATEAELIKRGLKVTGVPMDSIIGEVAADKGVQVQYGSFAEARASVQGQQFDCLVISNVLHLVEDPVAVLRSFSELLSDSGCMILGIPNLKSLPVIWKRMVGQPEYKRLGNFEQTGVHYAGLSELKRWLKSSGLAPIAVQKIPLERARGFEPLTSGLAGGLFTAEWIVAARKLQS